MSSESVAGFGLTSRRRAASTFGIGRFNSFMLTTGAKRISFANGGSGSR